MAKKKKSDYFSQTDWMRMDDPQKRKIMADYLAKAKGYLSDIAKDPMMRDPRSAWLPYADPAMSGQTTANMMMFQNVMRPRGLDRSEGALQQAGQDMESRIGSINRAYNTEDDWMQKDLNNIGSLSNYLQKINKRRNRGR